MKKRILAASLGALMPFSAAMVQKASAAELTTRAENVILKLGGGF